MTPEDLALLESHITALESPHMSAYAAEAKALRKLLAHYCRTQTE